MDRVAHLSDPERRELFQETASRKGMTAAVVEKDFWVCWVLGRVFQAPTLQDKLLFKGGTSLSKVFGLIERFSEDIDLILNLTEVGGAAAVGPQSSRDRRDEAAAQIRERNRDYLRLRLVPELESLLGERCSVTLDSGAGGRDASHPEAIHLGYPAAFAGSYLRPEILLEVSPLALWLPHGDYEITPYAAEVFPEQFNQASCPVRAILAERSFWEKATILHVLAHLPEGKSVPPRHSRHLYDLARMAQAPVRAQALIRLELLREVADFKLTYYAQTAARFDLARDPGTLRLVPDERALKELARDYQAMREMFYGSQLPFGEVVDILRDLESEIHALPDQGQYASRGTAG